MIPEQVFRRRPQHNNTPEWVTLIIANVVVFALANQIFAMCTKINNFFWVVLAGLALYNFYVIRRNREEFTRPRIISYVFSIVALIIMFFLLRTRAGNC